MLQMPQIYSAQPAMTRSVATLEDDTTPDFTMSSLNSIPHTPVSPSCLSFDRIRIHDGIDQGSPISPSLPKSPLYTAVTYLLHPQSLENGTHSCPSFHPPLPESEYNHPNSAPVNSTDSQQALGHGPSLSPPSRPLPRKRGPKTSDSLPSGFPFEYVCGPTTLEDGVTIPAGKYRCSCSKILSIDSWAKNGRTHEKSTHHTTAMGLPAHTAINTRCPLCKKDFRSDSLRRHLAPGGSHPCSGHGIEPPNKNKRKVQISQAPKRNSRIKQPEVLPSRTPMIPAQEVEESNPSTATSSATSTSPPFDPRSPVATPTLLPVLFQLWSLDQSQSPHILAGDHRQSVVINTTPDYSHLSPPVPGLGLTIPPSASAVCPQHASPSYSPLSPRDRYRQNIPRLRDKNSNVSLRSPYDSPGHLSEHLRTEFSRYTPQSPSNPLSSTSSLAHQANPLSVPSHHVDLPGGDQPSTLLHEADSIKFDRSSTSTLPPLEDEDEDELRNLKGFVELIGRDPIELEEPIDNNDTHSTQPGIAGSIVSRDNDIDIMMNNVSTKFAQPVQAPGIDGTSAALPMNPPSLPDNQHNLPSNADYPFTFHPHPQPTRDRVSSPSSSLWISSQIIPEQDSGFSGNRGATTMHPGGQPSSWFSAPETMTSGTFPPDFAPDILNADFEYLYNEQYQHSVNTLFGSPS